MRQAIEASCNIYFYRLGLDVGFDIWSRYVHLLGFGQPTGIDLPGEKRGLAPTEEMLVRRYGKNWTSGHMANMVIGQGDVLVTPLQMARFASIIANAGRYFTPHIVRAVRDNATGNVQITPLHEHRVEGVTPEAWAVLRDGMFNVVQGDRGTARGSRIRGVQFAGKTGSAENPHGNSHAWFIGYAPADTPRVSWAVIVENGGTGGGAAAPIARVILQEIFKEQMQQARQRAPVVKPVVPPTVDPPVKRPPDTPAGDTVPDGGLRQRTAVPAFMSESRARPNPNLPITPE